MEVMVTVHYVNVAVFILEATAIMCGVRETDAAFVLIN